MTTFARRAERVQPSAIREFLALAGTPGITSFAGGYPDPTLFPMHELHGIYADLLRTENASALQYTASDGLPELRALVAPADSGHDIEIAAAFYDAAASVIGGTATPQEAADTAQARIDSAG